MQPEGKGFIYKNHTIAVYSDKLPTVSCNWIVIDWETEKGHNYTIVTWYAYTFFKKEIEDYLEGFDADYVTIRHLDSFRYFLREHLKIDILTFDNDKEDPEIG